MKTYPLILLLLISVLVHTAQADATENDCNPVTSQNLITNGGFEKTALKPKEIFRVTSDIPGWVSNNAEATGKLYEPGNAHSGTQVLELATDVGYNISQTIKTQPGQQYLLRFWGKFRKPQYNQLNIFLKNYPNWACGTESQFALILPARWQGYSYILCPDTHSVTLEFGQQRETGGGYGLHLDTVSLVPCTAGRPTAKTLAFLSQTWVHSHEEGDRSIIIWRKAGSRQFPSSRFRRTVSFYNNGKCQFLSLEPNDTHQRKSCSWDFDPANNKLVIREATGQIAGSYQLNSLTQDLLTLSQ